MRKIEELAQEFPTIFGGMREDEIKSKLQDLNTSSEYEYVRRDGIGTFDINDNVEVEKGEHYDSCEGKFTLELRKPSSTSYNLITVYATISLWKWDEEYKCYQEESIDPIGWELNF